MPIFIDPLPGAPITGRFGDCRTLANDPCGRKHQGIDLSAAEGTPIRASNAGYLTTGDDGPGHSYAGLWASILGGVYSTFYCHLSRFARTSGWIGQGEIVGYVGHTGNAQGDHLHFEVVIGGVTVDPLTVIRTTSGTGGSDVVDAPELDSGAFAEVLAQIGAMDCSARQRWLEAQGFNVPTNFTTIGLSRRHFAEQLSGVGGLTLTQANRFLGLFESCDGIVVPIEEAFPGGTLPVVGEVGAFLERLTSGELWKRVGYVLGGVLVGMLGLYLIGKSLGITLPGRAREAEA